jgi:cell division protein ZipA
METSTLRWVLILLGLAIIALIFLFGNPERKRKPRASRRTLGRSARSRDARHADKIRREPTLGETGAMGEGDGDAGVTDGGQGELNIGSGDSPQQPAKPRRPAGPAPDRIVTLYLLAQDNHVISGAQLLEAAVKTGMDFGEMNIFHRTTEGDSRPVFSLANAAKPGHFDRSAWHEFETGALVLFTTLPNPVFALDAWDAMLATARRMEGILNGELHDEDHHPFSRQREAQIREEMRDYDRKRIARAD